MLWENSEWCSLWVALHTELKHVELHFIFLEGNMILQHVEHSWFVYLSGCSAL